MVIEFAALGRTYRIGDGELAKRLVDVAAAGADAVKFQTWRTDKLVGPGAPLAGYPWGPAAGTEAHPAGRLPSSVVADVAVVMAAHNEERYIERALRSCLHQSAPGDLYEIVVIDDGSTDATRRIAETFDGVRVLTNEVRLGLPASLNRGLQTAHCRFVVRVDADDYVHHDFIRVLSLFLDLNPYMDAVACDYLTVDEREAHLEQVNCLDRPIGCGVMFRKERLIELGLYDESFLMAEDLDLRLRFEQRWKMHRVELPLYRYRLHGENMTADVGTHRAHQERALRKNKR